MADDARQLNSAGSDPAGQFRFSLTGWAVVELLIAALLLPVLDELLGLLSGTSDRFDIFLMRRYRYTEFTNRYANVLWCLQVGLIFDVIGRAGLRLSVRWLALLSAMIFLAIQDGTYDYSAGVWLSLATVIVVWFIWDPSPFVWRSMVGTALVFILLAAWYSVFGRRAMAIENALMVLHSCVIAVVLLLVRFAGWQLTFPLGQSSGVDTAAKFSFAQLLMWVTGCALGMGLLRFVDFGSPHTLEGLAFLPDDQSWFIVAIFGLATPAVGLLATFAVLHERWFRYWLMLLTIAAIGITTLACLSVPRFLNPYQNGPDWLANRPWLKESVTPASALSLIAAAPTSLLMIYRSAGFRWSRQTGL